MLPAAPEFVFTVVKRADDIVARLITQTVVVQVLDDHQSEHIIQLARCIGVCDAANAIFLLYVRDGSLLLFKTA